MATTNPFDVAWQQCVAWARQVLPWISGGPATAAGYLTDPGYQHASTPGVGDAAVFGGGVLGADPSTGHIGVVVGVSSSTFTISQTNWPEGSGADLATFPLADASLLTFLQPPAGDIGPSIERAQESALGLAPIAGSAPTVGSGDSGTATLASSASSASTADPLTAVLTAAGHSTSSALVAGTENIGHWLARQVVGLAVAGVVAAVLFGGRG